VFVVFVANSSGKALARTRALLDSYAIRIGDQVWATPITKAALEEVRRALRRRASRQMSVACYRNDGRSGLKLEWIVGNRQHYDRLGRYAAQTQTRAEVMPQMFRCAALLARLSGESHDLGKATVLFQRKLRQSCEAARNSEPVADAVRHEWVSALALAALAGGRDAAGILVDPQTLGLEEELPVKGINSAADAAVACVVTHHYGLGHSQGSVSVLKKLSGKRIVNSSKHVRHHLLPQQRELLKLQTDETRQAWTQHVSRLQKLLARLQRMQQPPDFWLAAAFIARAALFLADHEVSSRDIFASGGILYANTSEGRDGKRALNQELFWHLREVGRQAAQNVRLFANPQLPCLDDPGRLLQMPADVPPRFRWQYEAASAMPQRPTLVFNVASTGAGKTRANVMLAVALRGGRAVRLSSAFNLRTLTLQTHTSYSQQLGFAAHECACLVGDPVTREVHAALHDDREEGDLGQTEVDVAGADGLGVPRWVEQHLLSLFGGNRERAKRIATLVAAPVLVSTIDFLDAAGDVTRGNEEHAWALLRLMHSDLILDEIDSYDSEAMVAVLRLVFIAGMLGRNVIVSSATLCQTLAVRVAQVWRRATDIARTAGLLRDDPMVALVSDKEPAEVMSASVENFAERYSRYMTNIVKADHAVTKLMVLAGVERSANALGSFCMAVEHAARQLHGHQRWQLQDWRVSVGLVRVANISTCIAVAEHLRLSGMHVMTYHAREPLLRRAWKEMQLDRILRRTANDQELQGAMLDQIKREFVPRGSDAIFVVVATPVEEVGRDHDFDWAVIEPSSAHSIVQTAGRVNRHRLHSIKQPNVAILQYCLKDLLGSSLCVFTSPGNEIVIDDLTRQTTHRLHDAGKLLGDLSTDSPRRLDASLLFGPQRCEFVKCDEQGIDLSIANAVEQHILGTLNSSFGLAWFGSWFGDAYPLRRKTKQTLYSLFKQGRSHHFKLLTYGRTKASGRYERFGWIERADVNIENTPPSRSWLSPSYEDVANDMQTMLGRSLTEMDMSFSVIGEDERPIDRIDWRGVVLSQQAKR
jgi:CRISPR-associated endonuclease/helicase Cas3